MPGWYCQLDELAGLALPEPWRFRNPDYHTKNPDTPILERYIHSIFKKQVIDFNEERNPEKAADYLHVENEFVCFHTGLYTRRYKAVYGCFDRNKRQASMLDWYFRGFSDELSPWLKYISPLPKKPSYYMAQYGVNYNPEWPIRVNIDHILGDEENLSRLPASIRDAQNLPLLLETAVELARRKALIEPSIVVPQTAFNWLCVCTTIWAEISRLRITEIRCWKLGIFWLANSSSRQVTWVFSAPPFSSALSHRTLNICV